MRAVGVGDEIESVCGKCGPVWHVVAAMVGNKVVKVVCKRCGAQHRHRSPPGSAPAPAESAPTPKPEKRSKAKSEASKAESAAGGAPRIEPDLSRPIKPYQAGQTYLLRDRIEHRTFGVGVVEELSGPGKIQVRFPDGPRKLLHGVPAAK